DEPEARAYEAMAAICAEHPETRGVYVAIDNGAEGVARYLRAQGARPDMTVIGTGVYPEIRALMAEGLVQMSIFQNTLAQGQLAVHTLFRYLSEGHQPDHELLVPPYIAVNNNIDLWL
ncbi:MAG TPA: substrate-binding domain-containing protein, partial [Armatimonadota bacterium]